MRLFRTGVTLTPHTDLVAVEGSTVVANAFTGAQRRIDGVDTVVLSMGSRSTDAIPRTRRNRGAARDRRWRRTARHPLGHPRGHACGTRSEVGTPSLQPGGDLANLLGRVLLSQRRAGEQVFAPREAADEHWLKADCA